MLTTFFIVFTKVREHTNMWDYKIGQFMVTGGCSSFAWLVCWPFELLKNLSQSGNKEIGSTILQRASYIWRNQGLLGFYRGTLPGI